MAAGLDLTMTASTVVFASRRPPWGRRPARRPPPASRPGRPLARTAAGPAAAGEEAGRLGLAMDRIPCDQPVQVDPAEPGGRGDCVAALRCRRQRHGRPRQNRHQGRRRGCSRAVERVARYRAGDRHRPAPSRAGRGKICSLRARPARERRRHRDRGKILRLRERDHRVPAQLQRRENVDARAERTMAGSPRLSTGTAAGNPPAAAARSSPRRARASGPGPPGCGTIPGWPAGRRRPRPAARPRPRSTVRHASSSAM